MNNFIKSNINKLKLKNFENPHIDLRVILNNCSYFNKEIFLSNCSRSDINLKKFYSNLNRRLKNEPISKIIKKKSFWKYDFFVNKNVIDPRPESELIIEETIKLINLNKKINILDVGSGSGCLSICLAKEYKNAKIEAVDISNKANYVARKNIKIHKCRDQIINRTCSFDAIKGCFDLIVSNPPYLSYDDYKKTSKEIRFFEPKLAFLAGKDGLLFYKKFAKILPNLMKLNSYLIMEIGPNQANLCKKIFQNSGLKFIKKVKDLQKKDRILIFSK